MSKGVIVSIDDENSIVLTEDGNFVQLKKQEKEVGENINIGLSQKVKYSIMSAVMMMFMIIGSGVFVGVSHANKAVSYFSIDINPSIEFTLNASGKVLSVAGANDDGKVLISNEKFEGMPIEMAAAKVVQLATESGYFYLPTKSDVPDNSDIAQFDSFFNAMMFTVINDDYETVEKIKVATSAEVKKYLEKMDVFCLILSRDGNYNNKSEALQEGLSLGKMELVKLVSDEIPHSEAKDMSVTELTKRIQKKHMTSFKRCNFDAYAVKKFDYIENTRPTLNIYTSQFHENEELYNNYSESFESIKEAAFERICNSWDEFKKNWFPPCKQMSLQKPLYS